MNNDNNQDKLRKISKILLQAVMGLIYIVMGIFVILKHWFMIHLEPLLSYGMGAVLIIYGTIRIYRSYIASK